MQGTQIQRRYTRGFSLIELMIAVAIIGLLATIAIPMFNRMQLRARRSEVKANLSGLATAEESLRALYGGYLSAAWNPSAVPTRDVATWDWDGNRGNWRGIEWEPDGLKVMCRYKVVGYNPMTGVTVDLSTPAGLRVKTLSGRVRIHGQCDLDGDGRRARYWLDLDPDGLGGNTQHRVLRPNAATANQNRF